MIERMTTPNKWNILRLDEVFQIARGGSPRPIIDYITEDDGYNWIKIGDTKNIDKYIYKTKQKIRKEGLKKSLLVKEDDFILSNSMSFGKPYIMKTEGCIHDGWLLLRKLKKDISVDFMYYVLSSDFIKIQFISKAAGSTVQNLNIKLVETVKVLIPPLPEQQKIADILSTVDHKIEVVEKQIIETQKLKKGLMQSLLTKGIGHTEFKDSPLGKIPESWKVVKINEVTSYVDYRGKTPPKVSTGILLITARNIKMGKIDYEISKEFIPQELYNSVMSRGVPKIGDVLITTEAPLGNIASVDNENIALAQRVIKYRGNSGILDNSYLKQYMLGSIFQSSLEKQSTGSTVKGIKGSVLHKLNIALPSLSEQQKIATILNSIDDKIEVLLEKKINYKELKQGLMQQLLTGKIRVKV